MSRLIATALLIAALTGCSSAPAHPAVTESQALTMAEAMKCPEPSLRDEMPGVVVMLLCEHSSGAQLAILIYSDERDRAEFAPDEPVLLQGPRYDVMLRSRQSGSARPTEADVHAMAEGLRELGFDANVKQA